MQVQLTLGEGTCKHVTVTDVETSHLVGVYAIEDLTPQLAHITDGLQYDFLTIARDRLARAWRTGILTDESTITDIKAYLESLEL